MGVFFGCGIASPITCETIIDYFILSFSGKLVSPKWKNFKGLKLLWRDKIRLNNAIWRAWYMQCKNQFRHRFSQTQRHTVYHTRKPSTPSSLGVE